MLTPFPRLEGMPIMTVPRRLQLACLLMSAALLPGARAWAALGNSWHHPANTEPPTVTMRWNLNPTNSAHTYFYNGSYPPQGDQNGGWLVFRPAGGSWASDELQHDSDHSNNEYWQGVITANTFAAGTTVEYYFKVVYAGHDDTFLGTSNNVLSFTTGSETEAQNKPFTFTYSANLGNCFHIPTNTEPPGVTMRNPLFDDCAQNGIFVYNGNQFQGGGNAANQSGGTVYYREVGSGSAWSNAAMVFDATSGNNKYWRGEIPANSFGDGDTVEYCFGITYTDRDTTYVGTTNAGGSSLTFFALTNAQAHPFTFTYDNCAVSAAAFLWHADNRVVVEDDTVEFWVKIGYIGEGMDTNRYVDFAHVYYTTNNTAPTGAYGVGSNQTFAAAMTFSHTEWDAYPGGDAMWWRATVTNLPSFTPIRYKIGAYKNTNGTERFADYQAGGEQEFSFALGITTGVPSLTVNGKNAEYSTTKFFIDERAGDTARIDATFNLSSITNLDPNSVEIFANVDRRQYVQNNWDGTNGIDAIRQPNFNQVLVSNYSSGPGGQASYYRPFPMTHLGGQVFTWGTNLTQCGAYRLSARYKLNGAGPEDWRWYLQYNSSGAEVFGEAQQLARAHAIVVSPTKALEMTLYEINTLTVEATDASQAGRSTFDDLLGGSLGGDDDAFDPFNFDHLDFLQMNCLWFQPIHPNGEDSRTLQEGFFPGSPYATRNYFAVSKWMGEPATEANAMIEFTNFVAKCDSHTGTVGTINVMLDFVANHTSWDAVFGQGGVDLGYTNNPAASIGQGRAYWYSDGGNIGFGGGPGEGSRNYCDECDGYIDNYNNDIAFAPDRGDFGKWQDVADFYFGRYSALVCLNDQDNGSYLNETDAVQYDSVTAGVRELWQYIAYYAEYWIKATGHPGNNSDPAKDDLGVDAYRCDFGQGLPPQLWEYIINRTRNLKWNTVFMAETLDGGVPGYRSNRHFDILNENLVFQFTQAHINNPDNLRGALEDRRSGYSGGAILLNLTSHDEVLPDNDAWITLSRYAALSSVDGLPMMFYGQEKGIGNHNPSDPNWAGDGFAKHELNFGKYVPHFKDWNKLTVWDNPPAFADGLDVLYGRINYARLNSPALRSRNRYFLRNTGGNPSAQIFAVAKYDVPGALTNGGEAVLCFANFFPHGGAKTSTQDTFDLDGVFGLLGLDAGKTYNIRNLASSNPNGYIWSPDKTGQELLDAGIFVSLDWNSPGGTITNDGAVVQYLKIEEVSAPNQPPVISLPGPHILAVGATTNFAITATDPDSNPVTTNLTVSPAGSTYVNGVFTWTPDETSALSNDLEVVANDQQAEANSIVTGRTYILVPYDLDGDVMPDRWEWANLNTLTNPPDGDVDHDGSPNLHEWVANTGPGDSNSLFKVQTVVSSSGQTNRLITVPTQPGKLYTVEFTDGSVGPATTWSQFSNPANGVGTWMETNATPTTHTFVDDESGNTTGGGPGSGQRSYRVQVK